MVWRERALSVAEHGKLCDAFLQLPGMRDKDSRELYVSELVRTHLAAFSFPRHADARHDVWSLLTACLEHEGGLAGLVEVVRVFHQGSRPMARLDELLESLFPDRLLTAAEHRRLVALLADLDPRPLGMAFRQATSSFWWNAVSDWTDVVDLVERLELAVGAGGVPPLFTFVDRLAHHVEGLHAPGHGWLHGVGTRLGLRRPELLELCATSRARPVDNPPGYVVLQLQPDGVDQDRYLMSAWLQQPGRPDEVLFRDDVPRTLAEVAGHVVDLVRRAHVVADTDMEELTLEFVVPRDLVHHPIDQWQVDEVFPHRLGTSQPVVVRSLDRMRRDDLRGRWRRKWRWLTANSGRLDPASVHWLRDKPETSPDSLFAELVLGDAPVAVVMSEPPAVHTSLAWDELTATLYAGVPIVVWCREPALSAWFEEEIGRLLESTGLDRLPEHVLRLRRQAGRKNRAQARLGEHITLLWDDADRIPESFTRTGWLRAPR
ncbi:VMAP-C domain-containing protein [Saccharothrix deserti]|uniref:VMAP-C domain-containing protein n=1 Tax=Saccharothrix deserti TaxID=2593674 RepID=UPI00131C8226|nr:hypothetical protein [Saccharothrix deserti]